MGLEGEAGLCPCSPCAAPQLFTDVSSLHIMVKRSQERCLPSTHILGHPMEQTPGASHPDNKDFASQLHHRLIRLGKTSEGWGLLLLASPEPLPGAKGSFMQQRNNV